MAIELQCGNCQGRLLVETPGIVVVCPHCGIHLQTPAAAPPATPPGESQSILPETAVPQTASPSALSAIDSAGVTEASVRMDANAESDGPKSSTNLVSEPTWPASVAEVAVPAPDAAKTEWPLEPEWPAETVSWQPPGEDAPLWNAPTEDATFIASEGTAASFFDNPDQQEMPDFSAQQGITVQAGSGIQLPLTPAIPPGTTSLAPASPIQALQQDFGFSTESGAGTGSSSPLAALTDIDASSRPAGTPLPEAGTRESPVVQPRGISPQKYNLVLNWARATTLACVFLIYMHFSQGSRDLESLPDLAPPPQSGKKTVKLLFVPFEAEMPLRHTLKIGESERYGSLRVTPLRVTRGPLEFVHYDPTSKEKHAPAGPVLKLYLKFENVSRDQEFLPLDKGLVFSRNQDRKKLTKFYANNFVCNVDQKTPNGKHVLLYDLPDGSPWDLKEADLTKPLAPGESVVTYLSTEEDGLEELAGDLIWRVHFRKGYNPGSGRGVTTLIEVAFSTDEIQDDAAPAKATTRVRETLMSVATRGK